LERVLLVVAHRPVVETRIAGDDLGAVLLAQMPCAPSDDDGELRLVVQLHRRLRANDRLTVRDERRGPAHEERGIVLTLERPLVDVVAIVQARAEDLPGACHREPESQFVERPLGPRRGAEREPFEIRQATGAQDLTQITGSGRIDRVQVDDKVAVEDPEPRAVRPGEANDPHDLEDARALGSRLADTRSRLM
jgi:hypothetical protein